MPLLDPDFVRKLDRLDFISRRVLAGRMKGERRTKRRGESIEFADFRDYAAGDDLRRLDWNVYARLDRLFLKLFLEEEDLSVYILLDASASMGFGEPSKLDFAKRLAAALGYIGLSRGNRVVAASFQGGVSDDGLTSEAELSAPAPIRGKGGAARLFGFLEGLDPGGETDLRGALRRFTAANARPGLAIVLSDLLDRRGFEDALKLLQARRMEVFLIHVLSRAELDPELAGELRLVDLEDQDKVDLSASRPLLKQYKKTVERFLGLARDYCLRHAMGYLLVTTEQPFEDLVLKVLRARGLVK
jgi:uncharacterized protein (DUF58 family)